MPDSPSPSESPPPTAVRLHTSRQRIRFPPEIISTILKTRAWEKGDLARVALVDKMWWAVATPLLWNNIDIESDLLRRGSSLLALIMGPVCMCRAFVRKLGFSFVDNNALWKRLGPNLQLLENLTYLSLRDVRSSNDLALLFDQCLPSLKVLEVRYYTDWGLDHEWDFGPAVDRDRARAFFAGLSSIDFRGGMDRENYIEGSVLIDAAHPQLRQIFLPADITDTIASNFFARCSKALRVVGFRYPTKISRCALQTLADRCEGVRALCIQGAKHDLFLEQGLVHCLERCGPRLVALELSYHRYRNGHNDTKLMGAIATYCRSLEYLKLTICDSGGLMKVMEGCGPTLKYLILETDPTDAERWGGWLETLIQTIGPRCPNLEGLDTYPRSRFYPRMFRIPEETLAQLLGHCKILKYVGEKVLGLADITSRTTIICFQYRMPTILTAHYFDYITYERQ
ncbi:hypothetical protein HK102_004026 [Quaeritorhiza haematococci]|nr:hypothetical protein HK102_004026 [Quaeritorhiza haematococci]